MYREMLDESAPVRLQTAPTGGESVYLFLEFTILEIWTLKGSIF